METNNIQLFIGFITYEDSTLKYLPYFLDSLKKQTFKDFKILVIDNSEVEENENKKFIKEYYSEIDFEWAGKNLGFAKAYNLMIQQAVNSGAQYFLVLNPDMVLETHLIEKLLLAAESNQAIGAVQPKILRWDFLENRKTKIIDSYGVICDQKFRFRDDKQGESDESASHLIRDIFGFTGAAVLLNLKALCDIAYDNGQYLEYFDELMFMYKEDCDLSLRLRLAGWKILLAPEAVAYHDRSASRLGDSIWQIIKNRIGKRRKVKIWSFRGQLVIVLKYYRLKFSLKTKFLIWWYQFKILVFTILFEQYLLKELLDIWRIRKAIKSRRRLKVKINIKDLEDLMR